MLKEVVKRDGSVQEFLASKIKRAILKANNEVAALEQATPEEIDNIVDYISSVSVHSLHIEAIQNLVENSLMELKHFELARKYITYRYTHYLARELTTTEKSIVNLLRGTNQDVMEENSNKNASLASTQRDLMAGEVSKDITRRVLLPDNIKFAIDNRWIHWHDMDYTAQSICNCCLIDIKNILENGTVINNVLIESPKTFLTACSITAQTIACVASNQYGGQSVNLKWLARYVAVSREKYMLKQAESFDKAHITYTEEQLKAVVEDRVKEEIKQGIQALHYQINVLQTTNGFRVIKCKGV